MPDNENKLATIEPETREETFLQDIADGTQTLTPAVRKEEFLRRIAAKPGVPSVTESDEGKVLTVESGEPVWGEASSLPEITAQDEGKVLTVESGEAVWGEASSLPEITAQDEGKVLTVDNGEAVWGEGGDSEPRILTYQYDGSTGSYTIINADADEVLADIGAGNFNYSLKNENGTNFCPLTSATLNIVNPDMPPTGATLYFTEIIVNPPAPPFIPSVSVGFTGYKVVIAGSTFDVTVNVCTVTSDI